MLSPRVAARPASDVPAARIRDFTEHIADEQTVHNGTYRRVEDPNLDGEWLLVRYPALYDGHQVETDDLPPAALPTTAAD